MNKTLKIFGILAILSTSAMAEDVATDIARAVGARTDCAAVAAEIATLNATLDPDQEIFDRLAELQTIQRRDCAKNTARRRAMARGGKMAVVLGVPTPGAEVAQEEASADTAVDETVTDSSDATTVATTENSTESIAVADMECSDLEAQLDSLRADEVANADKITELSAEYDARCLDVATAEDVQLTVEEIDAFIAAGLCADGTEPNKFGCCGDEVFKDLGDAVFACCPPDLQSDCFPPILKGGF